MVMKIDLCEVIKFLLFSFLVLLPNPACFTLYFDFYCIPFNFNLIANKCSYSRLRSTHSPRLTCHSTLNGDEDIYIICREPRYLIHFSFLNFIFLVSVVASLVARANPKLCERISHQKIFELKWDVEDDDGISLLEQNAAKNLRRWLGWQPSD